jgi:hypothetical protein
VAKTEVVLRDFDGTQTIFPTETPLRELIHTAVTDLDVTVGKVYARTADRDEHGRVVYVEQH